MRKLGLLMGILLFLSLSAVAQKVEIFGGYSLVNFQPGDSASSANFNGGIGSVAFKCDRWFSAVGEVSGYHNGNVNGSGISASAVTYMGGPKFSMRLGPVTPFVQGLVGGIHGSAGGVSENVLAAAYGGGLDWNVSKHFAVRLGQFEDLYTQFNGAIGFGSGGGSQNSFRYSTGIVFKL